VYSCVYLALLLCRELLRLCGVVVCYNDFHSVALLRCASYLLFSVYSSLVFNGFARGKTNLKTIPFQKYDVLLGYLMLVIKCCFIDVITHFS